MINIKFSEKSKHDNLLKIKQVLNKIPKSIQAEYAKLSKEQAEKIIDKINERS